MFISRFIYSILCLAVAAIDCTHSQCSTQPAADRAVEVMRRSVNTRASAAVNEQELSVFHQISSSVSSAVRRSDCLQIDSSAMPHSGLRNVVEPTIVKGMLSGDHDGPWSNWTREQVLQNHGRTLFPTTALRHNGAGFYLLKHMGIQQTTLAEMLAIDQPGNIFVDHRAQDLAHRMLHENVSSIGGVFGTNICVSFGSKGQWNQVHKHVASIFVQIKGGKGWSIAPPDSFPEAARQSIASLDEWEQRHLTSLRQADVCGPFTRQALRKSVAPAGSASRNLTDRGRFCTVQEGEAIIVPGGWWHGTCDLSDWSAGFARIGMRL